MTAVVTGFAVSAMASATGRTTGARASPTGLVTGASQRATKGAARPIPFPSPSVANVRAVLRAPWTRAPFNVLALWSSAFPRR